MNFVQSYLRKQQNEEIDVVLKFFLTTFTASIFIVDFGYI